MIKNYLNALISFSLLLSIPTTIACLCKNQNFEKQFTFEELLMANPDLNDEDSIENFNEENWVDDFSRSSADLRQNAEILCTESTIYSNYLCVRYPSEISFNDIVPYCYAMYSFRSYLFNLGYNIPTSQNNSYAYLDVYFCNCSASSLGYEGNSGGLTFVDERISLSYSTWHSTIYFFGFSSAHTDYYNRIYHEYFHAVQNTYYGYNYNVFKEATARWVGNSQSNSFHINKGEFYELYKNYNYRLDYYSNRDYSYSYIFDIIYDIFFDSDDTMYSFLLSFYESLHLWISSSITIIDTLNMIDDALSNYGYSFDDVWYNMVLRYLNCDTPYYDYFYTPFDSEFDDYFETVTYYGSGYLNTAISFSNWGFKMYDFPSIPSSPYYTRVKFQITSSGPFAIIMYCPGPSYSSVVFSNSNHYLQYTYSISTTNLSYSRFAIVNLTNVSVSTTLYIYQLFN